jgi:DNA polymerase-3 subunit delta
VVVSSGKKSSPFMIGKKSISVNRPICYFNSVRYNSRSAFLNQVKSSAAGGFLSRVYFIGIPHDYERICCCEDLLKYVLTPDHIFRKFDGSDLNVVELIDHLGSQSLFGGEPVAWIENGEKIPKGALQPLWPLSYGFLILSAKGKTPLSDLVEKEGVVFDLLNEKPWEKEKRILAQLEAKARSAGKAMDSSALSLLLERQDLDAGLLEREMDKLICYTGDARQIRTEDVLAICTDAKSFSLWQTAESIIWEGRGEVDDTQFHALVPALRGQLQLGAKIASLLAENAPHEEWNQALPKVFPKTLEKRTSAASRLGSNYFTRGLLALFDIELRSRTGSTHYGALLDLFRSKLISYAR